MYVRASADRGVTNIGWLNSRHTFSFGSYYDPAHMGFGPLRLINEDIVEPGQGFGTHGHRDMEILSFILDGALKHKDSTGNSSVIQPGDVQRVTAGTGIMHSEFNASNKKPVHFLQIWLLPSENGLPPGYEEQSFDEAEKRGGWTLIGSPDGRDGSVRIHQDVWLYTTLLADGERLSRALSADRKTWLQVTRGHVDVNGRRLAAGDGLAVEESVTLDIESHGETELLLFDMQP